MLDAASYEPGERFRAWANTGFGPHHATVEFVVPDLPAGDDALLHCNDPCTKHLGDLSGGGDTFAIAPGARRTDPRLTG